MEKTKRKGILKNIDSREFENDGYLAWRSSLFWRLYQNIKFARTFPVYKLPRNYRILDIGCGKGDFIRRLLALGYNQVDGIDIADRLYSGLSSKISFYCNSFSTPNLNIKKNYDVLLFQGVLHHIPVIEWNCVLNNILTLLNADGYVFFYEPNFGSLLGVLFHRVFLRIYYKQYKFTKNEEGILIEFHREWPFFVAQLAKYFEIEKRSEWSFYKILIAKKQ